MNPYEDIIRLPHHVSAKHPPMPMSDRAAQFSPFAALSGYDAAVEETARLTDQKAEMSEEDAALLNEKLLFLSNALPSPPVRITYFQPDARKAGGAYVTITAAVKTIDTVERILKMTDGRTIPIDDLWEIAFNNEQKE